MSRMHWLIALLIFILGFLQYRLWVGEGSIADLRSLQQEIQIQEDEVAKLRARNQALQAEVMDLNQGLDAIEERARSELGMIKSGEVFIQIIERPQPTTKP